MSELQRKAAEIRREVIGDQVQDFSPSIRAALLSEWDSLTADSAPGEDAHHRHQMAGIQFTARREALTEAHARIAFDDDAIHAKAKARARQCFAAWQIPAMEEICRKANIEPPPEKMPAVGRENRMRCKNWWRRKLRVHYSRKAEGELREMGLVHKRAGLYCSDATVSRRREQKKRGQELLQSILATNDAGEAFTLLELAKSSLSNPELRRAELMVRIRGFEECAQAAGHVGEFLTFTTPSRFHAYGTSGNKNDKYQRGLSPRESQQWLCTQWGQMRAKFARLSIRVYGFRIAEPHHDGTTHWHLLIFAPAHQAAAVRRICRSYLLADAGSERGAQQHRFKAVRIDPEQGTAAGYIAKYVAKNIDGFSVGEDYESPGNDASDTARRVDAWASTWGIRQFQQIGGPPVGLWRELRRVADAVDSVTLEAARAAADAGEWADFVQVLGGPTVAREAIPIELEKEMTGECTEYGEARAPVTVGVRCGLVIVMTRLTKWVFDFIDAVGGAWTRVNNCTAEFADEYEQFMQSTAPP